MKKFFHFFFVVVFGAGAAFAQLKVPPLTGRLNDTAGMVPANLRPALEQGLANLTQATGGGQLVVLTIPTLDGEDIEGYSLRVAETWKIGRKGVDDGALLLLVRDDRRSRLEIGYGWEGDINDARAGDVLRNIAAYLARGQTAEGIASAIGQIQFYLTGSSPQNAPPVLVQEERESRPMTLREKIIGAFFAIGFIILMIVSPTFRNLVFLMILTGGGRGGRRGGGGGGFRGGGGGFGGGGASGRW